MDKIQLQNSDFEGLNNIYVLEGDDGITLIDAGMNMESNEMYDQLSAGLEELGTSVSSVDRILLTHWHPDHVGLAGEIVDESNATVHIHEADAELVEKPAWRQMEDLYRTRFQEWGLPESKQKILQTRFDLEDDVLSGECVEVEPFEDGDEFVVGNRRLTVVHTPGHTCGLSCLEYEDEDGRNVFSSDALLPVYTPNVGGADIRVENALAQYLDSLERLIDREYVHAWPGHREPISDPTGRALEIIEHHKERTRKILDLLGSEPMDAWTVSKELFGELDDIHIIHGPGEAFAHLEHLAVHDVIEDSSDGYVRSDTNVDLDALFPSV